MASATEFYLHGVYVKKKNDGSDALIANVKDINTNESRLHIIRNATVPFWVTNKRFQNHKYKKECAPESELDRYSCKFSELHESVAKALGKPTYGYIRYKELLDSPYIYGADIELEALVKMEFAKACKGFPSMFNVGAGDIETSVKGNKEVIAFSYIDGITRQVYCGVYRPFLTNRDKFSTDAQFEAELQRTTQERVEKFSLGLNERAMAAYKRKPFTYNFFITDSELELITWVIAQIHKHKTDFVGFWNMNYDIKYLIERIAFRNGNLAEIMSHPDVPKDLRYAHYKEDESKGPQVGHFTDLWHWFDVTGYTQFIDFQNLYSRLRKVQGREISYKLDYIASKLLGIGKLDFGEHKGHYEMQNNDFVNYVAYNVVDSVILILLDELLHDVTNFLTLIGVNRLKDFSHQTVLLRSKFYDYCRTNKLVSSSVGKNMMTEYDHRIFNVGGAVLSPLLVRNIGISSLRESDIETGVTVFNADIDYKALYPSISQLMNISKGTKLATALEIENFPERDALFNYFANAIMPEDNAVYLGHKFYGLPDYKEMQSLIE